MNWHRAQLGWLPDVQTVSASGTYLLTPAEISGTPRLVRVARSDGTYLNLEFRQPWGTMFDNFSASDPVVNGVSIRIAPATTSIVQSKLVDANPSTSTFTDAALGVGKTVVDPLTGVSITTLSVGPTGASVSIQMPGGGDTQAPTGPASLSASATSSSTVQLSWPAATDNVGVAGYRVYRGGTQIAQLTGLAYLDSGLARRRRTRTRCARTTRQEPRGARVRERDDTWHRRHDGAVGADWPPRDGAKGASRSLTWTASNDNVGVAGYDVYRNGTRVAQPSGTSYSDRPGRGTFTYQVRARDAAGNVSGPSAGITVTT